MALNWDMIQGNWKQFKGEARVQWGKLTDDEWDQIAGNREKLMGKLQEHYGYTRERAEQEAEAFFSRQRMRARGDM
jgi:uncharacterized protein YjbJ (UPF0337 family)